MTDAERIEFEMKLSRLQKFIMNSAADESNKMRQLRKDIVDVIEALAQESVDNKIVTATEMHAREMESIIWQEEKRVILKRIERKNKIIDTMARMINDHDIDEDICMQMGKNKNCDKYTDNTNCINCIKQYFERKIKNEV